MVFKGGVASAAAEHEGLLNRSRQSHWVRQTGPGLFVTPNMLPGTYPKNQ